MGQVLGETHPDLTGVCGSHRRNRRDESSQLRTDGEILAALKVSSDPYPVPLEGKGGYRWVASSYGDIGRI